MRSFKLIAAVLIAALFLWVIPAAVLAQEEVPAPYAGLKNPFPWDSSSAQQAGKGIYQQTCLGCHGVKGNNIAKFDFSAASFSGNLKAKTDFYFWILSEGRLAKGMPPYKASLSEEQRWQVLTYLGSLGTAPSATQAPPTTNPPETMTSGTLIVTAPQQSQAGKPVTFSATLKDDDGKPVEDAAVTFFIKVDFFANSLMEIGEAMTDERGIATLEYVPRETGNIEVEARYQDIKSGTSLTLSEAEKPFYQAEAGLRLPAPGEDVFIGPPLAIDIGIGEKAPTSALRLPGGILSWLLFVVAAVALIWFTYFRVVYQVFRIPVVSEIRDIDTRLVPMAIMGIVITLGITLVLMLITGPYSHFHLLR